MSLSVKQLTGGYLNRPVIHDINFDIQAGEIIGLIGLNGAGKSTLIKHIIGLLKPQSGEIRLNGQSLDEDNRAYRQAFTYIPEMPMIYDELTLREHLNLIGLAYQIDKADILDRAMPMLKAFRLDNKLDWMPKHFSKGMRQKLMIVCAMMVEADLYIIDEPFLGLDPLATHDFIQILEQKRARGAMVLMSTHVLANAETYCDRFLFLHEGYLRAQGSLADIRQVFGQEAASLEELYIQLAREA
ncbi:MULTISPECIES: ABC transporter ATP-binding protein [Aerococcus]|uniref:ABC transporter ATP-binding protein n=1 Tax=Aerococcus sanguinicola TaxID=119206 RepID=A0A5N1GFM5_9LACT|nr:MULTISPECIES: ABC transporter ATP-binding protein [Aerococcus]KAA9299735.1 ABC transporter ATP-binding protein [Aerococcus sanguinicola]MDK6369935.1 ABC transporter ATP-binding protein [Aerococcus sp. UMB9870]MDK6680591.1 ABC transporter ATP-binding protein [Aerococcus sp. UMB8608]MDK6687318.1 ABC transporter ATP-binding protein [Aerococcus sp. UMB8623]MDK6940541.1 ABC transporter ATP-binding protein [Aerococcus sp. UMB8487]